MAHPGADILIRLANLTDLARLDRRVSARDALTQIIGTQFVLWRCYREAWSPQKSWGLWQALTSGFRPTALLRRSRYSDWAHQPPDQSRDGSTPCHRAKKARSENFWLYRRFSFAAYSLYVGIVRLTPIRLHL